MIAKESTQKPEKKWKRKNYRRAVPAANLAISSALGVFASCHALAADASATVNEPAVPKREWAASVRWENDTFGGTDRFYTDGVSLSLSQTGSSWLDPLADKLPWGDGRRTVGYDLAQGMFTPADTDRSVPDLKDRPYAGVLSSGLTLHVEKGNSYNAVKLVTGVVGPWALAKETQDKVHSLMSCGKSQGWSHQLRNEPILNLAYEYRHKYQLAGLREHWSLEALPIAGAWAGNALTQGQIGGLVRAGYNMPNDSGPTLVRGMGHMPPPQQDGRTGWSDWGFSVYGGSVGNLVLRDITLDGNTFRDSPSVDKKIFVPMAGVGMAVGNRRMQVSFSYIFWGKEFDGQQKHQEFGSISVGYFF